MKTPVGRLSGGERRMVSIGRGLMTDAKLYLADEPTLGLAPKIGMAVMSALLAIDLKDSAMFIAEQNVALLEGRVDRIIGMHAGKTEGRGFLLVQDRRRLVRAVAETNLATERPDWISPFS